MVPHGVWLVAPRDYTEYIQVDIEKSVLGGKMLFNVKKFTVVDSNPIVYSYYLNIILFPDVDMSLV